MNKEDLDMLYHLLRVVSNEKPNHTLSFSLQHYILGLAHHLLAGGDYLALIQFSTYYGERFLLEPTCKQIYDKGWEFSRVVEFGAGLSWLGRGIAAKFGNLPTLFIDKRQWTLIDLVVDLETEVGRKAVRKQMTKEDLIVAADLLHCLNNPREIMGYFSDWPAAILEYCPTNADYAESYTTQISRYGANPIVPEAFEDMFPGRTADIVDLDPYILILVDRGNSYGARD